MRLNQNNNKAVVNNLAKRSVRTGGRTSFLTAVTIALTAMLITTMVLQVTGLINSQKKMLDRAQQAIYTNLTTKQMNEICADQQISSAMASKTGQGVETNDVLLLPSFYEPATGEMDGINLAEGRMAEAIDETVIDKATLKAFGLPETIGTKITVEFLNSPAETFTVVGLTDYAAGGTKLPRHSLYLSREYAENGPQLAKEPWSLLVRIKDGADMSGPLLEQQLYQLGENHGVLHQDINPHNAYISLRTLNTNNVLIYVGIAMALAGISLLVIYSIFYLSVAGRVRQFGQLRTIGMTPKQLKTMVKKEGWLLWAIGTPLGFIPTSLLMLIIGPENGWGLQNNLLALAASALVCGISVRLGVQKPASIAAAASPIEAARFQSWQGKPLKGNPKPRELTPLGLAKLSFARNWKKQLLTMISLAIGGILFMAAAIYVNGWDVESYARQGEWKNSEYTINYDYNTQNSLENGTSKLQLKGLLGQDFQSALKQLPGVEKVTSYYGVDAHFMWEDIDSNEYITPVDKNDAPVLAKYLEAGTGDYDQLVQSTGVYVSMSGLWQEIYGKSPQIGDTIKISYYNGKTQTVSLPVVGVGSNKIRGELASSSSLIIPRETANKLFGNMDTTNMLSVTMKNHSHTQEQDQQMKDFMATYPQLELSILSEQIDTYTDSYTAMKAICISVGGFVVLFSLVNLLNTLLTSLISRRQQLALLAAIGMTRKQIGKMLRFENLLLAGVNLAATLSLGTLAGWGLCQLMLLMDLDYVTFTFPWFWFLLYAAIAVGGPILITKACLKSFYKDNLTDRLRTTE